MIVWLLDTQGPRAVAGVCDSETQAISDAEELLSDGRASTARVEQAYAHMGGLWIHSGYERTGSGQTADRADDGTVTWNRFYRPALAAS
jgi:hypothetical protein